MRKQLAPLLSLALLEPRMRRSRRELSKRLRKLSTKERERECINCVIEWLTLTCIMQYQLWPQEGDVRDAILTAAPFTLAILWLEPLVKLWERVEPAPERLACLRTVIELLARVESKRDQAPGDAEGDLVAAGLVWRALSREESGPPFFESVEGDPFLRSELYAALVDKVSLAEVVDEARRLRHLEVATSLPRAYILSPSKN